MLRNINGITIDTAKVWLIYGITHHNKVIVNYQFKIFYLVIWKKNHVIFVNKNERKISRKVPGEY